MLRSLFSAGHASLMFGPVLVAAVLTFGVQVAYADDPPADTSTPTASASATPAADPTVEPAPTAVPTSTASAPAPTGVSETTTTSSSSGTAPDAGTPSGSGGGTSPTATPTAATGTATPTAAAGTAVAGGETAQSTTTSGAAPADVQGATTTAEAAAESGAATAIGNLSYTQIVQIVIAIVNITMPGIDPASLVGPLVSISQTADVTNNGIATAISGGNAAIANILTTVAAGNNVTAQQLASLAVSGSASATSGTATAIGNLSWTEIMQLASVVTSINGDTSLTSQLAAIQQRANVTNEGAATANSGGNSAEVKVSSAPIASPTASPTAVSANTSAVADDDPGADDGVSPRRMLLWGRAPSADTVVWIVVNGTACKRAAIEPDPDFAGSYDWSAYLYPNECGAKPGAKITFQLGWTMPTTVIWDNTKRESPEIHFDFSARIGAMMATTAP